MRKRWTRKAKNKRNKQIIMCSLIGLMFLMVCGYSAFSTSLSLKAKGNIKEKKAADQLLDNVVDSGDGLYKDEYEEGRYFFKGANPNNYITFNDEKAGWRIISVEKDGTIKIMRNSSIGNMAFDAGDSNVWETSDVKKYLNDTYFKTLMVNNDKMVSHAWSIGTITYSQQSNLSQQIIEENSIYSESTNIGLITVSEYIRANSNIELCGNISLNNKNGANCLTTNWMYNIIPSWGFLWTISPSTSGSFYVFYVRYSSIIDNDRAYASIGVSPAFYLTSDIVLTGSGTEEDPYVITN